MKYSIQVSILASPLRVDQFLTQWSQTTDIPQLKGLSRSRFQQLIAQGEVTLQQKTLRASHVLSGGEVLEIYLPAPVPLALQPEKIPLDILYEDEHLIVINKPAGLVVHPGAGHFTGTLVHALLAHCKDLSGIGGVLRPGIVHRLDRDTSGVMVIAKTDRVHEHLAKQFAKREIAKYYVAFVYGRLKAAQGTIETFFGRHPKDRKRFTGRLTAGKRAITVYEVLYSANGISELGIWLKTGRTHQIRVHLSELGFPIIGDKLYGLRKPKKDFSLNRHALHAVRLEIIHPITSEKMVFSAPLSPDLAFLAKAVRVPSTSK